MASKSPVFRRPAAQSQIDLYTAELVADIDALRYLDEGFIRDEMVLPLTLSKTTSVLSVAVADADDLLLRDRLRRHIPDSLSIDIQQVEALRIIRAIDRCFGAGKRISQLLDQLQGTKTDSGSSHSRGQNGEQLTPTIIELVDALLEDANRQRASDIHLSPGEQACLVRYRMDGVLRNMYRIEMRFWSAILVRIKVMCSMDIAETRQPQDGHFNSCIHGDRISIRVSAFPLHDGENLVLRLLQGASRTLSIKQLGLPDDLSGRIAGLLSRPAGLIVVCGPTGSGKTTTLYAMLQSLDSEAMNIMTLEDPVEHPMPGIQQSRVNTVAGMDYAQGIRGLLRQDPDVLLVGEIRDEDSCAMAIRAALTGHLVLTSVHADDAVGAVARLRELGAGGANLATTLNAVIAQRLVRVCCPACRSARGRVGNLSIAATTECYYCNSSGFSGRMALAELLTMSPAMEELLRNDAASIDMREELARRGMTTMTDAACAARRAGKTSSAELHRIFGTLTANE